MRGVSVYDDWEFTSLTNGSQTVVLVGCTGNGKSASGNSILRRKAFKSMSCFSGVTSTCEFQSTVLEDGQILNVIDTPGLFDFAEPEFVGKEIAKCINMAKDGIHAILVVLSVRTRFSREEEAAIKSLEKFFGSKIYDYMIVIFTGGDELEENDLTLDDYLFRSCPEPLMEILEMCGNRRVLFDNKTKDELKKDKQLEQLLLNVNEVIKNNGGKPYVDEIFVELKKGAEILSDKREEPNSSYEDELIKRITDMVESKLKEATVRLEKQLEEEHAARLRAEESALEAQKKSKDEMRKLLEHLEKAQKENEEFRKREVLVNRCPIL